MNNNHATFSVNLNGDFKKAAIKFYNDSIGKSEGVVDFLKDEKINIEAVKISIKFATKDLMVRTLEARDDKPQTSLLDSFIDEKESSLLCEFKDYFLKNEEDFDFWHQKTCELALDILQKHYVEVHYGKAQKVVNMTFKYLLSILYANKSKLNENEFIEYCRYFTPCHMPVDSFIIEWIARESRKNKKIDFVKSNCPSWSNLDFDKGEKYTYKEITDKINKILKYNNNPHTTLEAEFFIWPEIQMHLAAEGFIFALKTSYEELSKTEKQKIRNQSIDEKLEDVKKALIEYEKNKKAD